MMIRSLILFLSFIGALAAPATAETPLTTVLVASGIDQPVFVTHAPGDYERIFVLERTGAIRIIKNGVLLPQYFLDVDPQSNATFPERGLLGVAFHPDFPTVNAFFIHYTDNSGNIVVARYSVSSNPDVANPAGDTILFVSHPAANHNGGWLGFGPDGYLYVALGDGGGQRDPSGLGQNITGELHGNILRLDVDWDDFPSDALRDYAIPTDNPLVGVVGEDEIWAYGLRNPWRNAFDSVTGDLYIADVGEGEWEELNFQPASSAGGENYGWDCFEDTDCTEFNECTCAALSWVAPIHSYGHTGTPIRCSIIGGEVYRGCAIPDLSGTYFFGDWCTGDIWSLRHQNGITSDFLDRTAELAPGGSLDIGMITSFGRDAAGEIYICDSVGGEIYKIVADPPLAVISADPPHLAIDARTPLALDETPIGWDSVLFNFASTSFCITENDFSVAVQGGALQPPIVDVVEEVSTNVIQVQLSGPIEPLTWTTIRHHESLSNVRLGYLPGDVDASRRTTPLDLLSLINGLNSSPPPVWSADIDRSESLDADDVEALIGVFDGVNADRAYLGASLP